MATVVERWLAACPETPLDLSGDPGRAALKSMVDGWLARMLAPLAERPLSLTELDRQLTTVSYPTIERRLEALRLAEQVEIRERTGGGTPYMLTRWLRGGVAPLAVAARWEHRHASDGAVPITRLEIESATKIAAPLISVPYALAGICQMAVRVADGERKRRLLGLIEVRNGDVYFGEVYPRRKPDAWASGEIEAWFSAIIDGDPGSLRCNGDRDLIDALLTHLHESLFGEAPEAANDRAGSHQTY